MLKFLLPFAVLAIIPFKAWSLSCPGPPSLDADFSNQTTNLINDFTLSAYSFTAMFSGGYVSDPIVTEYSQYQEWIILPAGNSAFGISSGEASITMTPPAKDVSAYVSAGPDVQARAQFIDEFGAIIKEYTFSNGNSIFVSVYSFEGKNPVSKLKIIIDGGTDKTYLGGFTQSDWSVEVDCGGFFGSINPIFILLTLFVLFIRLVFTTRKSHQIF